VVLRWLPGQPRRRPAGKPALGPPAVLTRPLLRPIFAHTGRASTCSELTREGWTPPMHPRGSPGSGPGAEGRGGSAGNPRPAWPAAQRACEQADHRATLDILFPAEAGISSASASRPSRPAPRGFRKARSKPPPGRKGGAAARRAQLDEVPPFVFPRSNRQRQRTDWLAQMTVMCEDRADPEEGPRPGYAPGCSARARK